MLKAYIFDFEGTLVTLRQDMESGVKAVKAKLEAIGFDREKLLRIGHYGALYNEAMKDALLGRLDLPCFEVRRAIGEVYDSWDAEAFLTWQLRENAKETLQELHHKAKLAILTSVGWKAVNRLLETHGIGGLFDILVTRDDITFMKPSDEGLRMILYCLKVSPDETIVIGDGGMDILVAQGIGAQSAFLLGGEHELSEQIRPDYVINSLSELLSIRSGNDC